MIASRIILTTLGMTEILPGISLCVGDPSLRLKNGSARDDADSGAVVKARDDAGSGAVVKARDDAESMNMLESSAG